MKQFAGNRPLKQIKDQCEAQGLHFDDLAYRVRGHDHVVITGGGARVFYNTFNGRFFGEAWFDPPGQLVHFNSDSTEHEKRPWFQALLSFFYVNKGEISELAGASMVSYILGGTATLS